MTESPATPTAQDPAQAARAEAVGWVVQALNDFAATMPKSVREAFVKEGSAKLATIGLIPLPTPDSK